jgi:hypothetical protein
MTNRNNQDECDKFVQASRGPLGSAYEAVRSAISGNSSDR